MFTLVNHGQAAGKDAGDVVGENPAQAVAAARKDNVARWSRLGAFDGDRTYAFGTFPATAAALINLEEVVVHNWDVAKATGKEPAIDPNVAAMVSEFCRSIPSRRLPGSRRLWPRGRGVGDGVAR